MGHLKSLAPAHKLQSVGIAPVSFYFYHLDQHILLPSQLTGEGGSLTNSLPRAWVKKIVFLLLYKDVLQMLLIYTALNLGFASPWSALMSHRGKTWPWEHEESAQHDLQVLHPLVNTRSITLLFPPQVLDLNPLACYTHHLHSQLLQLQASTGKGERSNATSFTTPFVIHPGTKALNQTCNTQGCNPQKNSSLCKKFHLTSF